MRTVIGRAQLHPDDGPLFLVVGVFDGLHRGHAYLLDHLVRAARARGAVPAVVTFDAHPDAVLLGQAPPCSWTPRSGWSGSRPPASRPSSLSISTRCSVRRPTTPSSTGWGARCAVAGFLMTPDAAFGYERAGTPATVGELGNREGFEVVVVPPFALDGREIRSPEIRAAIAAGDLTGAERLLGRPYSVVGTRDGGGRVTCPVPVALPPSGVYAGDTTAGDTTAGDTTSGRRTPAPVRVSILPDGAVVLAAPGDGSSSTKSAATPRSAARARVTFSSRRA